MLYPYRFLFTILLFFCCIPLQLLATEGGDDVFGMSFEELADMEVSVATGQRELLLDAPAVISRYSTDDMARLGLRTLRDILSFVPGVVNQNGINGNMPVMVRGVSEGFNQKVLFLLDDVPYWMPSHGDIPLLGIPIEAI